LGDTRRVLYRLPEIIQAVAAEKIVFVVEGEKAADALARVGVSATCSPGGAGKWREEYSTYLAGADVVILPDADSPGEQHCEAVAASLTGIAARVRVSFYACRGSRRKATSMIGSPKAETLNSFGIWSKAQRLTGDAPMPQKAAHSFPGEWL
jgi:5S rRNA maturation endonuclease (ribonuclease M5)